jgi:ankyrin repeat protein
VHVSLPSLRLQNSMTPMHYAAWQGSIDCVQLLLEHKADINKTDAVSNCGRYTGSMECTGSVNVKILGCTHGLL